MPLILHLPLSALTKLLENAFLGRFPRRMRSRIKGVATPRQSRRIQPKTTPLCVSKPQTFPTSICINLAASTVRFASVRPIKVLTIGVCIIQIVCTVARRYNRICLKIDDIFLKLELWNVYLEQSIQNFVNNHLISKS